MIELPQAVQSAQGCVGRRMLLEVELEWLYRLAGEAPDGTAVELGALCGSSFIAWSAARVGRGPVVAVDNKDRAELKENLAKLPYAVEIVVADSWAAAERVPGEVAFLFIDADHGIDGIPKDMVAWLPKVMPGGIVVFHDYGVWKPTVVVQQFVDRWQESEPWELLGQVRSARAYRRPG
jgi:predicted O-methyltransferase YrrM